VNDTKTEREQSVTRSRRKTRSLLSPSAEIRPRASESADRRQRRAADAGFARASDRSMALLGAPLWRLSDVANHMEAQ
jgi:hypothetical protein